MIKNQTQSFSWKNLYYDSKIGLYIIPTLNGSMYYSHEIKQFLSSDHLTLKPYSIGSLNPYILFASNPL